MKGTKKRPGRPRLPASQRRRNNITITMGDALKAELEKAAETNQRSVSAEIEHQLGERKLLHELGTSFGRGGLFLLMNILGNVISKIERRVGKHWDDDPQTTLETAKAVLAAMLSIAESKHGEPKLDWSNPTSVAAYGAIAEQIMRLEDATNTPKKEKQS